MTTQYQEDQRLDPRCVAVLENLSKTRSKNFDVTSREALIEITSRPEAVAREEQTYALMDLMDNERIASRKGLRIETHDIQSSPDGNTIKLQSFRPDTDETLPCVYYMHGGGMMTASCFRGCYQTWARLLAHHNLCVVMVDFRNALRPSSAPEVAPFPAGLNDCVSGFHWLKAHASALNIDSDHIVLSGESGGGNLSIATTMKLIQDGHRDAVAGLYALCPYISGEWPRDELPSTRENAGYFISVNNNHGAMAYGIEQLEAKSPLAWPYFASAADVEHFPPTMISVNECDPLRDEGIAFYRTLMAAGVKAHCRQVMGTFHAIELFITVFTDHTRMTAADIARWVEECRSA